MKILRRVLWGVLFISLVTPLLGLAYLVVGVNPNDYKAEITEWVAQNIQRQLYLEGDIKLHFFPWLGLQLGHSELSQAPAFHTADSPPFMAIDYVQLRLKLKSLFSKKVEMDTLVLKGLVLNLGRDENGQTNWADLQTTDNSKSTDSSLQLDLSGIQLEDARIVWTDATQTPAQTWAFNHINLTTTALKLRQAIDIQLKIAIEAREYKNIALPIQQLNLTTQVYLPDWQNIHLSAIKAQFQLRQLAENIDFSGEKIQFNLDSQQLTIEQLILQGLNQQLNIPHLKWDKNQQIDATINIKADKIKQTLKKFKLLAPLPPVLQALPLEQGEMNVNISGQFDKLLQLDKGKIQLDEHQIHWKNLQFNAIDETIAIKQWQVNLFDIKARGDSELTHIFDAIKIKTQLHIAPFNPKKLIKKLKFLELAKIKTQNPKMLQKLQLSTDIQWQAPQLHLNKIKLQLDNSTLTGKLTAKNNFNQMDFQLKANRLNLDDYLPPANKKAKDKPLSSTDPLAILEKLQINGTLSVDHLTMTSLQFKKIKLKIKQGKLLLH